MAGAGVLQQRVPTRCFGQVGTTTSNPPLAHVCCSMKQLSSVPDNAHVADDYITLGLHCICFMFRGPTEGHQADSDTMSCPNCPTWNLLLTAETCLIEEHWYGLYFQHEPGRVISTLHAAEVGSGAGKLSWMAQQIWNQSSQQPQRLPGLHTDWDLHSTADLQCWYNFVGTALQLHCQSRHVFRQMCTSCMGCRKEQACNPG